MVEYVVGLIIEGPHLDPAVVTTAASVEPDGAHRACDPRLQRRLGDAAWRTGQWRLTRTSTSSHDLEAIVKGHVECIRRIKDAGVANVRSVMVTIGVFDIMGTGTAVHLSSKILVELGSLGVDVMVDAYPGDSADVQ